MRRLSLVLLAVAALGFLPDRTRAAKPSDSSALWMPDVAGRVAALKERAEKADKEARARPLGPVHASDVWRTHALSPRAERPR